MSALLRVHRRQGPASATVVVDGEALGRLDHEVNDFEIRAGSHVVFTKLSAFHGDVHVIRPKRGETLEFEVVPNADDLGAIIGGGFHRLEPLPQTPVDVDAARAISPLDVGQRIPELEK